MTTRQRTVLADLRHFSDASLVHSFLPKWARPLDVGGRNGSHHGATLLGLAKAGLAEVKCWRVGSRRTFKYRISQAGREALAPEKEATDGGS